MRKLAVLLTLALVLTPCLAVAVSDQQWGYAKEISQRWVDQHNEKLTDVVKKAAQKFGTRKHNLVQPSLKVPELAKKSIGRKLAADFGISDQVVTAGVTVGLMKLYRTHITFEPGGEHTFLTAEYFDDLDPIHSSSDIYMDIGHHYFKLFHGEGFVNCARILYLNHTDEDSAVFFEVNLYGGGSQVRKILYGLDKAAIADIPQMLFDSPEKIKVDDYLQEKLSWSVWLDGETTYQDLSKDGTIEILNLSQGPYPEQLKAKLKEKYDFVNTDYTTPFRKMLTVYQWNEQKQGFDTLGEYYY